MTANPSAQGHPPEVTDLLNAVMAVKGVTQADLGKTYLPDLQVADLSLPGAYADLPIAALRRTQGGLANELLLSLEFRIERSEAGLQALEFLAWWVRDQSRGGENMQIRALGLPPLARGTPQLGQTLRFCIDWFHAHPLQDMAVVLAALAEKANSLNQALALYESAF